MESLNCPSCGGPLSVAHRFVKMVTCDFCGQISLFKRGALELTGKVATLTQLPSKLYLDATGRIDTRPFRVLGRLQYAYDDGYWHEWFVSFDDGAVGWLQEDEGRFTIYHKETLREAPPPYEHLAVGQRASVNGRPVFVTEKGEAQIVGGEGQLAFAILPGEQVRFIDGLSGDDQVSLEYTADEVEFMVGQALDLTRLAIDDDPYS